MELNIYKGEFGLASIDLECLKWITYSKFCANNSETVKVNFDTNPLFSPNGFLPFAKYESRKIKSFDEYVDCLKAQGFDLDQNLSKEDQALSLSWSHQITKSLYDYYVLTMFDDEANFLIIRKLYGQRITFPWSFYYPTKYQKLAKTVKEVNYGISSEDDDSTAALQKSVIEARSFLNSISTKLGSKPFMFGNNPSKFDAHLYAYLALLHQSSLPNNVLQSHIAQCPNLVAYIKRISKKFLAAEAYSSGKVYETFTAKVNENTENEDENAKNRKIQLLAGLFGVAMMTLYAVSSGIIERLRGIEYQEGDLDFGRPDNDILEDQDDDD